MRQLVEQLQQAAHHHRPGQRHYRRVEIRRGKQRKANHADVQQGWRKRRDRKTVPGIEDRPHQRGQRDQQNIRESHAQQRRSQREFIGRIGKARRGDVDNPGRRHHAQHGDQRQNQREQAGDIGNEGAGRLFALLAFIFSQDRHERLRECPFGKNTPQQIGEFKRHKKGIGCHTRAKHARHDSIAGKAQHP